MSQDYGARTPDLEWSHRSAAGGADDLEWVDSRIDPNRRPFLQEETPDGRRFSHIPYPLFMPPVMAQSAANAQASGQATMAEGLLLLYARAEWLVHSRNWMWSPLSPVPRLLAYMVEAFGIEQELHRDDPEVLSRLAGMLPTWHPSRGTVDRAREVLECTGDDAQARHVAFAQRDGERPVNPSLRDEVMACRSASFWASRQDEEATPHYRIENGFLKFQPSAGDSFVLRREDVLLEWREKSILPRQLVRLLPAWTVVRLVIVSKK